MKRRELLRMIGAGAVVACPLCKAALAGTASNDHGATGSSTKAAASPKSHGGGSHWDYEGQAGPEHWGQMSPEFQACGIGQQQSPINLDHHVSGLLNDMDIRWAPSGFEAVNNGHTIQANAEPGSHVMLGGDKYDLLQFHFHHPSEHLVDGRPYTMEVHFVHKSAAGNLTVLGAFMTPGAAHPELEKIWARMPKAANQKARVSGPFDPRQMLPMGRDCYRYAGSLTTPPCSEIVNWIVFRDPIEVSSGQIAKFARLYPANARPEQSMNRRFLLGNF